MTIQCLIQRWHNIKNNCEVNMETGYCCDYPNTGLLKSGQLLSYIAKIKAILGQMAYRQLFTVGLAGNGLETVLETAFFVELG